MKLWIARDRNNDLYLYTVKPILYSNSYFDSRSSTAIAMKLDEDLFPEVTFENSPQQVEIKLIKSL